MSGVHKPPSNGDRPKTRPIEDRLPDGGPHGALERFRKAASNKEVDRQLAARESKQVPADDPLIGKMLNDRYRVIGKLGEGGMGIVYIAQDTRMYNTEVAIKVISPEYAASREVVSRFDREIFVLATKVKHPNVVEIKDKGTTEEGSPFYVMELLKGENLTGRLERGVLTWQESRGMILPIIDALAGAHGQGVIHRDLKPDNIFIEDGKGSGRRTTKILDFGIAKLLAAPETEDALVKTMAGVPMGTPQYMTPEQAWGQTDIDNRNDVFSIGLLLYEMMTGESPFFDKAEKRSLTSHAALMRLAYRYRGIDDSGIIPPIQKKVDSRIPKDVYAVILKCLEIDRDKRYQKIEDVGAALSACKISEQKKGLFSSTMSKVVATIAVVAVIAAATLHFTREQSPQVLKVEQVTEKPAELQVPAKKSANGRKTKAPRTAIPRAPEPSSTDPKAEPIMRGAKEVQMPKVTVITRPRGGKIYRASNNEFLCKARCDIRLVPGEKMRIKVKFRGGKSMETVLTGKKRDSEYLVRLKR